MCTYMVRTRSLIRVSTKKLTSTFCAGFNRDATSTSYVDHLLHADNLLYSRRNEGANTRDVSSFHRRTATGGRRDIWSLFFDELRALGNKLRDTSSALGRHPNAAVHQGSGNHHHGQDQTSNQRSHIFSEHCGCINFSLSKSCYATNYVKALILFELYIERKGSRRAQLVNFNFI